MEFSEHRCRNCGGQLSQGDDGRWHCPYCSSTFENTKIEKHTENMSRLFDEAKKEIVNNLRRNLYDATHAEYISSSDVHSACAAIKQYLPDDFQANFYEIAVGNNVKQLTKAIRKIDIEKNFDDIESIIQFLIGSMQTEYMLELNNLVERAFKNTDLKKFEDYATQISIEAEKVNLGVYETKYPREVFVAYSSKDMEKVSELVEILEAQGMKCFVAARNLRHGKGAVENYNKALEEAMDHCRSFVFVSTPNSRSFNCDALSIELPYVQAKDIENAPAEYKNNYVAIPAQYKKPRVEYRIGENSGSNGADAITKEFFDGYEWVYSPDEVAKRIMKQLIASPQVTESAKIKYVDVEQKKICSACGAENSINTKFCGECGQSDFVNSVSEFIKLRKMQDEAEKAKSDAAIAEAERAAKEALEAAEKAKKDAEEKIAKAAAAEKAKKEAEARAKAAEDAKRTEANKTMGTAPKTSTTASYSASSTSSNYSSNYSSSYSSSSTKKPVKKWPFVVGIVSVLFVVYIIIYMSVNNDSPDTNGDYSNNGGDNNYADVGASGETPDNENSNVDDYSEYPQLSFTEVSGGLSVSADPEKLTDITGELQIPSEVNGKAVIEIAEGGFAGCSEITSLVVPDSVKTIGEGAFSGCSSLESITLPFVGLSQNPSKTSEGHFGYIFGSKSYAGGAETHQYYSNGGSYYIKYYIPTRLTSVTLTDAVGIGYCAFNNCAGLKEIYLNDGVMTVDERAFQNCSALESVNLPDISDISASMFSGCSSLKYFEIGERVTSIGNYAFDGCSSLSQINSGIDGYFNITDNVKVIGKGAFSGCVRLEEITLPFIGISNDPSMTSEGHFGYIFGSEDNWGGTRTDQVYASSGASYTTYYLPPRLSKVNISNAAAVGYGAFSNCSNLKEININDDVMTVGERAFINCSSITSLHLPSLTAISSQMLLGCSSLESFEIGNIVTSIGSYAFSGCTSLSRINSYTDGTFEIEKNVKSIGEAAFQGCVKLETLVVPFLGHCAEITDMKTEGMLGYVFGEKEYGGSVPVRQYYSNGGTYYYTYYIPAALKNVTVTNALSIGYGGFCGCNGLESIIINPEAENSIGERAFEDCSATVYYESYQYD